MLYATLITLSIEFALILRVMLRHHRQPTARIAWVAVIALVPAVGCLTYLLFGEVNIGRRNIRRRKKVLKRIPSLMEHVSEDGGYLKAKIPAQYQHLFQTGTSISGFEALGGNSAKLMDDSNTTIDAMIADIDAAQDRVHLLFYIWLPDRNGLKMVEALKRAALRGIQCRVMVDGLGSRDIVRSKHWQELKRSGVHTAIALKIGNPFLRAIKGRIDLRNHRKILVIDRIITYCGSQNCADPEFRVKAKYAPWVDAVIRFKGPVARQNDHLFARDWMTFTNENIESELNSPVVANHPGFPAQVVGTGPTVRYSAMPELFESLMHAARKTLTITTPYYVPDESLQLALCATAYRGVDTHIIFPARNDSRIVGAASRSYYLDLLEAGVTIHEYIPGLLHAKTLTLDGEITLIGSANIDRRSFELNYENNILLYDPDLTQIVYRRQQQYMERSKQVTQEMVAKWSMIERLRNNTMAVLGPLL